MNIPMLIIDALNILVHSQKFNCVFGYFHESDNCGAEIYSNTQ